MKILCLLSLLALPLFGQPSCGQNNAPGQQAVGRGAALNNKNPACNSWALQYWSTGFASLTIEVDSANDVGGVPGAWAAISPVTVGANPSTTLSGLIMFQTYAPWISVNLFATGPGPGNVNWVLAGAGGISARLPGGTTFPLVLSATGGNRAIGFCGISTGPTVAIFGLDGSATSATENCTTPNITGFGAPNVGNAFTNSGVFSLWINGNTPMNFVPQGQLYGGLDFPAWTSTNVPSNSQTGDTALVRDAAGRLAVSGGQGPPLANGNYADMRARSFVSAGTPGVSGCAISAQSGGNTAGTYTSGTAGACTVTLSFTMTAPNGWSCNASDQTTANLQRQSANTTTTSTITGTTANGDVVAFNCMAF